MEPIIMISQDQKVSKKKSIHSQVTQEKLSIIMTPSH